MISPLPIGDGIGKLTSTGWSLLRPDVGEYERRVHDELAAWAREKHQRVAGQAGHAR